MSHGLKAFDFEQFITCLSLVFTFYLMRICKFIVLYDFGSAAENAFIMRLTWCRWVFLFFFNDSFDSFLGYIICLGVSLTIDINGTNVLLALHYSAFFFAKFE